MPSLGHALSVPDHAFGPARGGEPLVYGARRPGYPDRSVDAATVEDWIRYVRGRGVERVCCLLDDGLDYYPDLLGSYRAAFGPQRVCHAPIPDYSLADPDVLHESILPFLRDAAAAGEPVVVHCSAGSGRTGHVLVAWLVCERGLGLDDVIAAVEDGPVPRHPTEGGSRAELRALLDRCL